MSKCLDPKATHVFVRSGVQDFTKHVCNKKDECGNTKCVHYSKHKESIYAGNGRKRFCTNLLWCKVIEAYTICGERHGEEG